MVVNGDSIVVWSEAISRQEDLHRIKVTRFCFTASMM